MGCVAIGGWVWWLYSTYLCSAGTLLADLAMMCVPLFTIFISWRAGDMNNFWANDNGLAGFIMILFTFQASAAAAIAVDSLEPYTF